MRTRLNLMSALCLSFLLAFQSAGHAQQSRNLAGIITVEGVDHETFGKNETTKQSHPAGALLNTDQPAQTIAVGDTKWGGECRVEVHMNARALGDGRIQIEGKAQLYEGDSEDTNDLDDEETFTFVVPRTTKTNPAPVHHTVQLKNEGAGGGDSATVVFSFTNLIIEEN